METLKSLSSGELTERMIRLRRQERAALVEFLEYLAEMDRRQLFRELGFTSLFKFCRSRLGMTKTSAIRRIVGARLMVRFPMIAAYLADGRLTLVGLYGLRNVLIEERLPEILDRASGKTLQEIDALVASCWSTPDAPSQREALGGQSTGSTLDPIDQNLNAFGPGRRGFSGADGLVLQLTFDKAFVADLEEVRDLLLPVVPDRNLEKVIHECVKSTILTLRGKSLRTPKTGRAAKDSSKSRRPQSATRVAA